MPKKRKAKRRRKNKSIQLDSLIIRSRLEALEKGLLRLQYELRDARPWLTYTANTGNWPIKENK